MANGEAELPCVVLAGGKAQPEMVAATGQTNRALVVVGEKRLLDHVLDALEDSHCIATVCVVGDLPPSERYRQIPDAGDFVSNLFAGVEGSPNSPYLLIATADLPFLTGAKVREFVQAAVQKAEETGATLLYPIVPVSQCYARFPNVKRTAIKLREGEFTGGNLMLVRPAVLTSIKPRIAEGFAARKQPLRLATMLGFGMVARLLLSQLVSPRLLSLSLLERRVSRLLGTEARVLLCNAPEIATDLDRLSDFAAVGLKLP
jgi:GTP:adenosylcobinamide-phosphate guanylyltransferase